MLPDYWPLFEAYHGLREPLYRRFIADAGIAADALILDAACGDAFYSRLMRDVLGPDVRLVAFDHNLALLQSHPGRYDRVQLCLGDLERAGLARGSFDAIWLCRAMHSATRPQHRIDTLSSLLRPGGKLIIVENDLAHNPILSWPATFERRFRQALHRTLHSRSANESALSRYFAGCHLPAWMKQAGLQGIEIHTQAVEDIAPMPHEAESYWKMAMDYLGELVRPFLSPADRRTYQRAFDPASPDYLLRRDGFYCMELITVACATAPS